MLFSSIDSPDPSPPAFWLRSRVALCSVSLNYCPVSRIHGDVIRGHLWLGFMTQVAFLWTVDFKYVEVWGKAVVSVIKMEQHHRLYYGSHLFLSHSRPMLSQILLLEMVLIIWTSFWSWLRFLQFLCHIYFLPGEKNMQSISRFVHWYFNVWGNPL